MRLTPSWVRSSSEDAAGDGSADSDDNGGVTIYHTPLDEGMEVGSRVDEQASTYIPDSDIALVAEIDELNTPVTVDEVADQLVGSERPPVETWASIHEQLHEVRLPALADTGNLVFDKSQGLVERPARTEPGAQSGVAVAASGSRAAVMNSSTTLFVLLSLLLVGTMLFVAFTFVV